MRITVYFSLGDVMECENVRDTRRFWRNVSKWCKRMSYGYEKERVVKVVKTNE